MKSLHLERLEITSLSELSSGRNQVVKVKGCRAVTDFHCLSGCQSVDVVECPLFTETSVLRTVENLYFEPTTSDLEESKVTVLNLEGVTEMEFSSLINLSLLQTATRLKTVMISEDEFDKEILQTLFTLPCLQKVILLNSSSLSINTELLNKLGYERETYDKRTVFTKIK